MSERFEDDSPKPDAPLFDTLLEQAKAGFAPQEVINTVTKGYQAMMPDLQVKLMSRLEEGFANKDLPPELKKMMGDLVHQTMGTAFSSATTLFERKPVKVTPTRPETADVVAGTIQEVHVEDVDVSTSSDGEGSPP